MSSFPGRADSPDSSSDNSIPNVRPVTTSAQAPAPAPASVPVPVSVPSQFKMRRTGQEGVPKSYMDSLTNPPATKSMTPINKPNPSTSFSNTPGIEDDLELVTSDVVGRSPRKEPDTKETATVSQQLETTPARQHGPGTGFPAQKQRTVPQAQKDHLSRMLKERWANGSMSHVHDKIKETKRRKSLASGEDEPPKKRKKKQQPRPSLPSRLTGPIQGSGSSARENDLWHYIQQHIENHRGTKPGNLPTAAQKLLGMPRVRDIEWNEYNTRVYTDNATSGIGSFLMYLVGEMQPEPCYRCKEKKGPYKGCVKLLANSHIKKQHCANCWYGHQVCSLGPWVGPKRNGNSSTLEQSSSAIDLEEPVIPVGNFLKEPRESTWKPDSDGSVAPSSDNSILESDDDAAEESEVDAQANELLPEIARILRATSGRLYDDVVDESGTSHSQDGHLLLPDGYVLRKGAPKPWICPVADCDGAYRRSQDLRYHFGRKHYATMLNDNGDGTFSVLGLYDIRKPGMGGAWPSDPPSLPIVVSQDPVGRQSPNSETPRTPSSRPSEDVKDGQDDADGSRPMSGAAILSTMKPEHALRARAMWDYVRPHLDSTKDIPATGHVKELLPLPRVRELEWNPNWTQRFVEKVPRDISCLIVQVTGEEAPEPCTECAGGKKPWASCVVIARDANPQVRSHMISCANCNYHGKQYGCSITKWVQEREQSEYPPYFNPKAKPKKGADNDEDATKALTPGREGARAPSSARPQPSEPDNSAQVAKVSRSVRPRQSQQVPPPDEALTMDDWEFAPGRIRFESPEALETLDNAAMSNAYINTSHGVHMTNDLSARLADVQSGDNLRLGVQKDTFRDCFIVNGRFKVRIEGEPEFVIGPRGMFKVPSGKSCSALNISYFSASVLIHSLVE